MRFLPTVVLVCVMCLSGCAGSGLEPVRGTWRLREAHRSPAPMVTTGTVALEITPEGTVTLSTGCNALSGRGSIRAGRLRVDAPTRTLLGCDGDRAEQEGWMAAMLAEQPHITVVGNRLTLSSSQAELVYERT